MKRIIISPFSRPLRNGKINAKNYPFWEQLIQLKSKKYHIIQIGRSGEPLLKGVDEAKFDLSFDELRELVNSCDTWISVDNFFPHFCKAFNLKRGIVIFGRSDPEIFGYAANINLLKDKKNLRPDQYNIWEAIEYSEEVFVKPDVIINELKKLEHI